MISEAMGKILGMAMAYGVSALGLLLAYYNYRKRVVKAERIMSGTAWLVILAVFIAIALGTWTVFRLTERTAAQAALEEPSVADGAPLEEVVPAPEPSRQAARPQRRTTADRWPWIGVLVPALIFLFATWVTAALHRHFSDHGHGPDAHKGSSPDPGAGAS